MDETVAQPIVSAAEREHRSKRSNESLKLAARLLNSSAIAAINSIAQRHLDLLADGG